MASAVVHAKVSSRGQTSLPAELRHRWGIDGGGNVAFVDLGEAALILPGGIDQAKVELKRVLRDRYEAGLEALVDPDLADQ
ncbi:MAG TPA: AbrB/MazE/SpoVT family DNA-binding domain-containing protein [Acidimicrobiales bacterium]|nr:AbrB/MazE/SpoVT family DNA-binding domain-containing protein [Acidimicrobiales bacterium]